MARPKTFEPDQALDAALDLFWRRGYEAASMAELQHVMGIGRQSIYDTFGDKHELFLKALDRYIDLNGRRLDQALLGDGPVLPALREHFNAMAHFLTPAGERPACLVTNTILERGHWDTMVSEVCKKNERNLLKTFEGALRRAVEGGEIDELDDPHSAALFLASMVYGMSVLAKNGASRKKLQSVAQRGLAAVGIEEEPFDD